MLEFWFGSLFIIVIALLFRSNKRHKVTYDSKPRKLTKEDEEIVTVILPTINNDGK